MLNAHVLSNAMCFLAMCARHCLSLQLAVLDDHVVLGPILSPCPACAPDCINLQTQSEMVASEQHSSSNPSHAGRQSQHTPGGLSRARL